MSVLAAALVLLFLVGVAAVVIVGRVIVGRSRGVAPHCRACGFDLTGLWGTEQPADRCPECGSALDAAKAVSTGRPVSKKPVTILSAAVLLALVGFLVVTVVVPRVNWLALKPTSMLIRDAGQQRYFAASANARELARRHKQDPLTREQLSAIFDACLLQQQTQPFIGTGGAWPELLTAAVEAGAVAENQRQTHLQQLFVHQGGAPTLQSVYVLGQSIPAERHSDLVVPHLTFGGGWAIPGEVVGLAPYLEQATIDSHPIELKPTPHVRMGDSPHIGPQGEWTQHARGPGSGVRSSAFPKPNHTVVRFEPPVGEHELAMHWRIEAFILSEKDPHLAHPFREPDFTWNTTTTHAFEVVPTIDDAVPIVRSTGPNRREPPLYAVRGDSLRVTKRTKLRRDGDWLYEISGSISRLEPADDADFALLGAVHLVAEGVEYREQAFPPGSTDGFYDRSTAKPVRLSQWDPAKSDFRINIIDPPHLKSVDVVITPTPLAALHPSSGYPGDTLWDEPIILRDVPIDWSAVPPPPQAAEQPPGVD